MKADAPGPTRWWRAAPAAVLVLAFAFAAGCDDASFSPFAETDRAFSLFGYLDTSADTQWVRVTPLRQSREGPDVLDATVTLDDLTADASVVLQDSLFRFPGGPVHNAWTTVPVEPGHRYRLTVSAPGGAQSTVDIAMPSAVDSFAFDTGASPGTRFWSQTIRVWTGAERLAVFDVVYDLARGDGRTEQVTISYLESVRRSGGQWVLGSRLYDRLAAAVRACPTVVGVTVVVATTTEDWIDLWGVGIETIAIPGRFSNVQNGLGFVGGVASEERPWPEVLGAFRIDQEQHCRS